MEENYPCQTPGVLTSMRLCLKTKAAKESLKDQVRGVAKGKGTHRDKQQMNTDKLKQTQRRNKRQIRSSSSREPHRQRSQWDSEDNRRTEEIRGRDRREGTREHTDKSIDGTKRKSRTEVLGLVKK